MIHLIDSGAPPPPYQDASMLDTQPQFVQRDHEVNSDAHLTIPSSHFVPENFHIFQDSKHRSSNSRSKQELYVLFPNSNNRAYNVTFPSKSPLKMLVHRGRGPGHVIATVTYPARKAQTEIRFEELLGDVTIIRDLDLMRSDKRIAVVLTERRVQKTFYLASTKKYDLEQKDTNRGIIGDTEIVDEAGKVYGVFLNEKKAAGVELEKIGQLDLLAEGVDDMLLDQFACIFLALIERYSLESESSNPVYAVAAAEAVRTTLSCVVS